MKYPQLVSTRAVNAISDWLVSQLEQLGVESPLIYSRLLLSLLHSSVEINNDDPSEFNNLEHFLANRKGKKHSPCDPNTLKKLTAIQCLMETVSSEQEVNKIENLVDVLCEKLSDIERQINSDEEDYFVYKTYNTISFDQISASEEESTYKKSIAKNNNNYKELSNYNNKNKDSKSFNNNKDIIEDPRIRYYSAFPALTKEMENSFKISSKRSVKALTWPTCNIVATTMPLNNSLSSSSIKNDDISNTAGVKRKTKRRRNQAMFKGRMNNIRKTSYPGSCSPTWDTDFEGSWEMGRDLIKEFITKQNNRNRSTSESAADSYNNKIKSSSININNNVEKRMKSINDNKNEILFNPDDKVIINLEFSSFLVDKKFVKRIIPNDIINKNNNLNELPHFNIDGIVNEIIPVDDEEYSAIELVSKEKNNSLRRLYDRENANNNDSMKLCSNIEKQQQDFAQFKAKFNSSVEALWKNNNDSYKISNDNLDSENNNKKNNNNNINNFWENYYSHHYGADEKCKEITEKENDSFYSMPNLNIENNDVKDKSGLETSTTNSNSLLMQESIWSDNMNNCDDDISFYANIIKSNNKMNKDDDLKDLTNKLYNNENQLYPFNNLKWSEGINAASPLELSTQSSNTSTTSSLIDRKKLRENMLKNSYFCNNLNNDQENFTYNSNENNKIYNLMSLPENISCDSTNIAKQSANYIIVNESKTDDNEKEITLKNHSTVSSGFIEYTKIKKFTESLDIKQQYSYKTNVLKSDNQQQNSPGLYSANNNSNCEENLLISEKTHFRPIKQTYADGYTFDITSNIDEVNFDRSPSGHYLFDSNGNKYLEICNSDLLLATNSLQNDEQLKQQLKNRSAMEKNNEFTLKFRIKNEQNEKHCQTDTTTELLYKNSLQLTKKKHIVKIDNLNNNSYYYDTGNRFLTSEDNLLSDKYENEDYQLKLKEKWSMFENGQCKKCLANNNDTANSGNNTVGAHTMWGQCNDEHLYLQSIPANRLLKDELKTEADDLIKELKYMQDLYIGTDYEQDSRNDWEYDNDDDACIKDEKESVVKEEDSNNEHEDSKSSAEQIDIFYNVTKLISDLLKPENATKLANVLAKQQHSESKNKNEINDKYCAGGLWSNDLIWKNEFKPIDNIITQFNNNNNNAANPIQNNSINWKYSNLAELWNNCTDLKNNDGTNICERSIELDDRKYFKHSNQIEIDWKDKQNNDVNEQIDNLSFNISDCDNVFSIVDSNNKTVLFNSTENFEQQFLQLKAKSNYHQKIVNRFDRKRRHSASQQPPANLLSDDDMENIENNSFMNTFDSKYSSDLIDFKTTPSAIPHFSPTTTATIINIKYWTTKLQNSNTVPIYFNETTQWKNNDGMSAAILNPSTILKHVVRPLTR